MEKISVIIPVYNCEFCLKETVESVLLQSYGNFEILLVDDGSTDNSLQLCNDLAVKDSRIRVFHKENGGVSSARNLGLKNIKGNFVVFIDSDDFIANDMLECLYHDINSTRSDVAICGFKKLDLKSYRKLNNESVDNNVNDLIVLKEPFTRYYDVQEIPCVWNKLYRKEVLDNIWFDEKLSYAEDLLFTFMVMINVNQVSINKNIKYFYINRKGSLSWQDNSLKVWYRYVNSKKIIYDKLCQFNINHQLVKKSYDDYCKAVIAVYRYVVHKRLKIEYQFLDAKYGQMILKSISNSDISVIKKLEYLSLVLSYRLACFFHKEK